MSGVNLSNLAQEFFRNPQTWTEVLMNGWVLICFAGFIGFAVAADRQHRSRRELITVEEPQVGKHLSRTRSPNRGPKNDQEGETSFALPGQSSVSSIQSFVERDSEKQANGLLMRGSQHSDTSNPSSSGSNLNSPVGRVPKVLFRPIVEDVFDGRLDLDTIQPSANQVGDANPQGASHEQSQKRGFLPFVGRRFNRDVSNLSLASTGSVKNNGSSRGSFSSLVLSPGRTSRSSLDGETSVHGPKTPRTPSFLLPSPVLSVGSRNSSPASSLIENHPRESQLANEPFHIALARDECGICYTLLHKEPVAVCADAAGKPMCLHIYHDRCLKTLRTRSCVFCKSRFHFRRRVPEVDLDPKGWFETVDVDQSGGLTAREIARVLAAQLPVDRKALEALLYKYWSRWDTDKNGEVDPDEFFAHKRGLLAFLKKKRALFKMVEPELDPPDIRFDARGWFEYFDQDRSNSLSKSEVLRGLILSFSLSKSPLICLNLRKVLDAVWGLFDSDGNGTISKREFLEPKTGLATSLTLSLTHSEKGRLY